MFVTPALPPARGAEPPLPNHPWFPEVRAEDVRDAALLDGTVTPARLRDALLEALDSVNSELARYREDQQARGADSLADVHAERLNGESVQCVRYRRAVTACVQALVAEAHREIDTTPHNSEKESRVRERLGEKIEEHRRRMRWAISDILGVRRTTVDLI